MNVLIHACAMYVHKIYKWHNRAFFRCISVQILVGLKQYQTFIKRAPLFLIKQTLKVPNH